ncbi:4150_t:CDS:2, partial [Scutellospora calospora]
KKKKTRSSSQFVLSTQEEIKEVQQASRNKNTDKSMNIWIDLFNRFYKLHEYSNEIKELDNKTLSDQLEQFIVEIHKSNSQEYKASSLYTRFCAIAQEISESDEVKLILNSPATSTDTPRGLLQKELDNSGMQLKLPKEKNHVGGIKDLYTEAGISFIPPDALENIYIPVADIKKYLSKHIDNTEDDYFFVGINTKKNIYHSEWYLPTKLGKGSHNTMMHTIYIAAKLDLKGYTITNHSMRSTGIYSLMESDVTLNEQMIFLRHKTIAGVSAYQHQSVKHKLDNVSRLIPINEAELGSHLVVTSTHELESHLVLNDSTSIITIKKSETFKDDKLDNEELKFPKISVKNCNNISINITFNTVKVSSLAYDNLKKINDLVKVSSPAYDNLKKITDLVKVS